MAVNAGQCYHWNLMSFFKWVREQGLREILKRKILLRATKQEILLSHDSPRPRGTVYI